MSLCAYYNENDPYAAQWLRNLIRAGHIAPGVVDERSIEDVEPEELTDFNQCHFFAGVGIWSLALRMAGWPDNRPVWTGSCPCQPFSTAGKKSGFDDERHLWPSFQWLIRQRRPPAIFGEQVASKAVEPWVDLVQADLEALGYAFGCVPFPSAGVGAPHIRDRAYWVGNSQSERRREARELSTGHSEWASDASATDRPSPTNGFWSDADWLYCRDGKWRPVKPGTFPLAHGVTARVGRLRAYGNGINAIQAAVFIGSVMEII